ncbi:MAG: GAF domain-containing protein [Acidobacteria bacterium]|nr:GAF domain-containing protein [Acidobacteriota bacterium]
MSWLTLLHSPSFPVADLAPLLERDSIESRVIERLDLAHRDPGRLVVIILDQYLASNLSMTRFTARPGATILACGLSEIPAAIDTTSVFLEIPEHPPAQLMRSALKRAFERVLDDLRRKQLEGDLSARNEELTELTKISIALSTVRDHHQLISMILRKSRELSRSDAGSLYLLDEDDDGHKVLKWVVAQNESIAVDFEEKVLPITKKSLAGYVALTGETLVIDDAYNLPQDAEYSINTSFDRETGYLTRSMLVFPMRNHLGDTIGVLQLINRKRPGVTHALTAANVPEDVVPFDSHSIQVMRSLAGQAAVAVENNLLYESIERLFEGFVTAAVTAIEQRDPTTSGHSFRVADLTVELARTADALDSGPFASVRFSHDQLREIRYASLLHDFGKVGVRENVLVKAKKLYPLELDLVQYRFDYIVKAIESRFHRKRLDWLLQNGTAGFEDANRAIESEMESELAAMQVAFERIVQSNEPTVLAEGNFEFLQALGDREFVDGRGTLAKLLTPREVSFLSIRKGNLDPGERGEIESHVTHTFHFLSKIPWTKDLRSVPDIAYAHHEKINGRGYPRGLRGDQITLQSRMMTISDIFDALTAKDRPYKKAVPHERALDILHMEMKDGLLDEHVVQLFVEAKIYEKASALGA